MSDKVSGAAVTNDALMRLCMKIARGWSRHRTSVLADYLYRQLRPYVPRKE